ncbi:MAG: glycosyltransferase family 39 protein [Chlorobium phaeobacteroides]|nr:glycosyltransferase family 39 protein [Chlorobium phaeobacteroides]
MDSSGVRKKTVTWHYLLLALLIFISFFAGLGSTPLFDVDEGAFSEATREMLESGNYLTTYLNGQPRFDKPILIYWMQALSVTVFGLNEFALRLPSALASTLWALLLYRFCVALFDRRTAFVTASLLILSLQVTIIGKAAIADALLNCTLAASMFAIFLYYREPRRQYLLLAFTAIGLGTLTKGPVAILIPFSVSFLFYLSRGELREWFKAVLNPAGMLIFALIVLPWYILEYLDQGMAFIEGFFFNHNISRFKAPLEQHGGALWYYIPVLLLGLTPSTALLIPVVRKLRTLLADPLDRFLLIWFAFVFLFFSLSGTKLPHYIIYGYTPLFILMGRFMPSLRHAFPANIWPATILLLLATAPVIIRQISGEISDPYITALLDSGTALMESSGHTLILSLAAAAIIGVSLLPNLSVLTRFLTGGVIFCLTINLHIMPLAGKIMQEPIKEAALIAKEREYKIVMWKINNPSFLVYSESRTERRKPEPGEIVLTSVTHLRELQDPVVIYEKNGIVLAKLSIPANRSGTRRGN